MRIALYLLGHLWALPHTLFGLLLLATVYRGKVTRWSWGGIEVRLDSNRDLIPKGMENGLFETAAQTHGVLIFYVALSKRLRRHERRHVLQCIILGGVLYPAAYGLLYVVGLCQGKSALEAYKAIWFEKNARAAE